MPLEGNNYADEDQEGSRPLQSIRSGIKAHYTDEQC